MTAEMIAYRISTVSQIWPRGATDAKALEQEWFMVSPPRVILEILSLMTSLSNLYYFLTPHDFFFGLFGLKKRPRQKKIIKMLLIF